LEPKAAREGRWAAAASALVVLASPLASLLVLISLLATTGHSFRAWNDNFVEGSNTFWLSTVTSLL
jgi:hypothetical protein